MKAFWLNGRLVVESDSDEERKALEVLFRSIGHQNQFVNREENGFSINPDTKIPTAVNRV